MRKFGKTGIAGLALTCTLVAAGCAPSPNTVVVEPEPAPKVLEAPKDVAPIREEDDPRDKPAPISPDRQQVDRKPPASANEMVTVSVYTIDEQCNDFVEESMQVPSDEAIDEAVGKAVNSVDYNAFKIQGYDVSISGNTAIVDMTLAPGSQRQFLSLSSCEQRALFGSVERTLMSNANWQVDNVKFTDSGKDLRL